VQDRRCGLTAGEPEVVAWLAARLPDGWFAEQPALRLDREEILVVGRLPDPPDDEREAASDPRVASIGCIERFREQTREVRVAIAEEAEAVWGRKLSWGVSCEKVEVHFTTVSTPVMTRLRMEERAVLDTLIDAGVARSRSEALAWCVRLVSRHEADWITELRDAVEHVRRARAAGPDT
jgi:hypothetical protein